MAWVHEGEQAVRRLHDLSLTLDDLAHALAAGDRESRRYLTKHDPPNMPGLARWAGTVRGLRDRLAPAGWGIDNPGNLPVTLSPDRTVGIVAVTGDEHTGVRSFSSPSTRRPRGIVTLKAIERNRDRYESQLPLFFADEVIEGPVADVAHGVGAGTLWILLYREDGYKIWSELSLPLTVRKDGTVNRWHERILLPAYSQPAPGG
ncbi:hypothetical protein LG943_07130 [Streptomonospora sp. S1-112]|uniref:Uncharacterized protein n=1 Tax=Streptomonospora mangrovi TaxID=2883123 RepID=A0A9X3NLN6_9ACTN|nr:hypothetical protein [Streptomonospora mangrovi]MDA0564099.1 hypothetical protein [Streptomonospora mangrovi]